MNMSDIELMIYGLIAWLGISFILIILLATQTPAFTFLKAKMQGKSVLFKKIKGTRMMDFELAKSVGSGALRTRKGYYFKNDDTGFFIKKGKLLGFLIPDSIAQTVNTDFLFVLEKLEKEYKKKITSFEDYKEAVKAYKKAHPNDNSIKVQPYLSVKFRDLDSLFPENLNVDLQESVIAIERRKASMMDKLNMKTAIIIMIILIGVGIVIYFISKSFQGTPCPACQCFYETAKNLSVLDGGGVIRG